MAPEDPIAEGRKLQDRLNPPKSEESQAPKMKTKLGGYSPSLASEGLSPTRGSTAMDSLSYQQTQEKTQQNLEVERQRHLKWEKEEEEAAKKKTQGSGR